MSLDPVTILPDTIAETLRTHIIEQRDPPGTAITESVVALRFGVARPTAKVAIERLVADGILRREPHKAARVPELSRDDIVDLYESRAVVEGAAMAALSRGGTIPADALAAHRSLLAGVATGAPFAAADIAFHRALVAGQMSVRLARMHSLLMGEIELCIGQVQAGGLLDTATVAEQHQGILDAVTAGQAELAERRTHDHIEGARDKLLAHFDSTHPPRERAHPW